MTSPDYLIEISAIALLDDRLTSAAAHDATDVVSE
jgi:hypothetical protein